jgi:hypothetical protein
MATLYSRLTSDEEVQDYHFLVDPIDHHRLTPDGFPQLKEDFPHSNINVVSPYRTPLPFRGYIG